MKWKPLEETDVFEVGDVIVFRYKEVGIYYYVTYEITKKGIVCHDENMVEEEPEVVLGIWHETEFIRLPK